MCPIWPLHIVAFYLMMLCPLWVMCQVVPRLTKDYRPQATFEPSEVELNMNTGAFIQMNVTGLEDGGWTPGSYLELYTEQYKDHIASVKDGTIILDGLHIASGWSGFFRLDAKFLGKTSVGVRVVNNITGQENEVDGSLPVTVIRVERPIDTIFTVTVATLVSIIFINYGCAVDWDCVRQTVQRPVGPAIGFVGQFFFMPMISYVLGLVLFPNSVEMRIGMFFTGISPPGGASNMWTFILGGNLNLSITMTTITTICAFGTMPLWMFTLGRQIFRSGNLAVPYARMAMFTAALVVPLFIGLLVQRYLPRVSAFMVRILKGFSGLLLVFIIVFAAITNLYLFELFSWQIIVAGMGVPWMGYMVGYGSAKIFGQSHADALTIALETGIQNIGIAIFLLRISLGQPEADLTTVIPVSVAIMTPFPMMALYVYQKIMERCCHRKGQHKKILDHEAPSLPYSGAMSETPSRA